VGAQRGVQVVHQRDVGRVVQAGALGQQARLRAISLGVLVAGFGEVTWWLFSSTVKSPARFSSPVRGSASPICFLSGTAG
jgi:hypothetical protein